MTPRKIFYVYRITHIQEGRHYVGYRGTTVTPNNDFGIKYFTSSKDKNLGILFKNNPELFRCKIISVFSTAEEALSFEVKYHKRLNVKDNPKFYNLSNQTSSGFDVSGTVGVRPAGSTESFRRIPCEEYSDNPSLWETPSTGSYGNDNPNFGNVMSECGDAGIGGAFRQQHFKQCLKNKKGI